MINYGYGLSGFIISLISLLAGLFASIISCLVVISIIYYAYTHRLKREERPTLVLSMNIYIFMLVYSIILISTNIQTIIGDIYGTNFYSSSCIFRGYFTNVIASVFYCTFVTQAFYRLCCIVYSHYSWLQLYWFYMISTPIQMVIASALLSPLLILHDIVYFPDDYTCFISMKNIRAVVCVVCIDYGFLLLTLLFISLHITLFLHRQPTNLALEIKRRQNRDLVAIKRIFINVGLLVGLGLPGTMVLIMTLITGVEQPLTYHIVWIGAEIAVAILSVEMIFTTPQLKKIVWRSTDQNRVIPMEAPLQMGPITTTR